MDDTPHAAADKPRVAITYCTQCNWLLRAAWMAQELLSTFRDDLGEVALIPATGGAFSITLGADTIWERTRDGGFPDVKVLKQRVRDRLDPGRDLGHIDRARSEPSRSDPTKSDPTKLDSTKLDSTKLDSTKPDPTKSDPPKSDP